METEKFMALWEGIRKAFDKIIDQYDQKWRIRERQIGTRFLILFIFRLIIHKDHRGYGCTLTEIFTHFFNLGIKDNLIKPAPSSICEARTKLDPCIFKELNNEIIAIWGEHVIPPLWRGHRLYAIDGSRFTLPRELLKDGYKTPGDHAHYPQGLVSSVYDLLTGIAYDFDIVNHNNERKCAINHLKLVIPKNSIVCYDRGYFSFEFFAHHVELEIYIVARLKSNTGYKEIEEFWNSAKTDEIIIINPPNAIIQAIKKGELNISINPIKIRLIKYTIQENTYVLTTLLLDKEKYPTEIFPELYHSRWGIEEMIKISKLITGVQDFHSKTEVGIKQELFAHFLLISMLRMIEFQSHHELKKEQQTKEPPKRRLRPINRKDIVEVQEKVSQNEAVKCNKECSNESDQHEKNQFDTVVKNNNKKEGVKINNKNAFVGFGLVLEKLLYFEPLKFVTTSIQWLVTTTKSLYQKIRPDRRYRRESKRPPSKWFRQKKGASMEMVS